MNEQERNQLVIREFTRIFKNEHHVDGVDHLVDTKNFTHHFRESVSPGYEGLKQVGRRMTRAFPDVVVTEEDLISSGDRVVERSSAVGTHMGALIGEKPTAKIVRWSEIFIYRVQDEKIQELWVEISMIELMQQIGALRGGTDRTYRSNTSHALNGREGTMAKSLEVVQQYREAVGRGDFRAARKLVRDDLSFHGPIDRFDKPEPLFEALKKLLPIVERIEVRKVFVDESDVCLLYDMVTKSSGTEPIAEWFKVCDDKIASIRAMFDARPFVDLDTSRQ